ncbi:hypothetical protein AB0E59_35455 [Lentzea sp. NPDC034063]|uniref:hypothetical protein n=1 Tax=unclassified Lentzea TaxID=2643253 RepID=UPI0034084D7F
MGASPDFRELDVHRSSTRFLAVTAAGAALAAAAVAPASAGTPVFPQVATASAYALTVNGQTEGFSRTWLPGAEPISFWADEVVVGRTPLHPGWGVHLADEDAAPQLPESGVALYAGVGEGTNVMAERVASIALTDSRGPFLAFGEVNRRARCNIDPDGYNAIGDTSKLALYLRDATGEMVKAPSNGLGVHTLTTVDAGDSATPDGAQRTTTIELRGGQRASILETWRSEFPHTYEWADGIRLTVTQQLGTEPPVVYSFLLGGGACGA